MKMDFCFDDLIPTNCHFLNDFNINDDENESHRMDHCNGINLLSTEPSNTEQYSLNFPFSPMNNEIEVFQFNKPIYEGVVNIEIFEQNYNSINSNQLLSNANKVENKKNSIVRAISLQCRNNTNIIILPDLETEKKKIRKNKINYLGENTNNTAKKGRFKIKEAEKMENKDRFKSMCRSDNIIDKVKTNFFKFLYNFVNILLKKSGEKLRFHKIARSKLTKIKPEHFAGLNVSDILVLNGKKKQVL